MICYSIDLIRHVVIVFKVLKLFIRNLIAIEQIALVYLLPLSIILAALSLSGLSLLALLLLALAFALTVVEPSDVLLGLLIVIL